MIPAAEADRESVFKELIAYIIMRTRGEYLKELKIALDEESDQYNLQLLIFHLFKSPLGMFVYLHLYIPLP